MLSKLVMLVKIYVFTYQYLEQISLRRRCASGKAPIRQLKPKAYWLVLSADESHWTGLYGVFSGDKSDPFPRVATWDFLIFLHEIFRQTFSPSWPKMPPFLHPLTTTPSCRHVDTSFDKHATRCFENRSVRVIDTYYVLLLFTQIMWPLSNFTYLCKPRVGEQVAHVLAHVSSGALLMSSWKNVPPTLYV